MNFLQPIRSKTKLEEMKDELKKNEQTYTKKFDKYLKENKIEGHLRSNSIVMCQMVFTSDKAFFDRIGEEETKRYFDECYKFICNIKNLEKKTLLQQLYI